MVLDWKIHGSVRALGLPGSRRSTSRFTLVGTLTLILVTGVCSNRVLFSPRSCVTAHLCSDSPYAGLGPRSPLLQKSSASNESPCCLFPLATTDRRVCVRPCSNGNVELSNQTWETWRNVHRCETVVHEILTAQV